MSLLIAQADDFWPAIRIRGIEMGMSGRKLALDDGLGQSGLTNESL